MRYISGPRGAKIPPEVPDFFLSKCLKSLELSVEVIDGEYLVDAEWLETPISAPTFEEAYWAAIRQQSQRNDS